jgi:hypothetical protein
MANLQDFKKMTRARLRTVDALIKAGDWDMAAYMMGYVLECGLKGAICSRLNLDTYPDGNDEIARFFKTHKFDPLLIMSGLFNIFRTSNTQQAFHNWSDFTKEYSGDWPSMRYDSTRLWSEAKIRKLYIYLTDKPAGVLTIIMKRW